MTAYRFNLSLSNIIVNKGGVFLHINYISIWTESKSKFRLMCKEAKLNNQDIFGCPLWIALMDTYMDTKLCSILNRLSKTRVRFPPPPQSQHFFTFQIIPQFFSCDLPTSSQYSFFFIFLFLVNFNFPFKWCSLYFEFR